MLAVVQQCFYGKYMSAEQIVIRGKSLRSFSVVLP
jgi:hypothetical protein